MGESGGGVVGGGGGGIWDTLAVKVSGLGLRDLDFRASIPKLEPRNILQGPETSIIDSTSVLQYDSYLAGGP